jgi:hypothetical protein
MVLVESPDNSHDPILTPWVRVARLEAKVKKNSSDIGHQHYNIDFVHVDYLETFVKEKLLPFGTQLFERAGAVAEVLSKGLGTIEDYDTWSWGKKITPGR